MAEYPINLPWISNLPDPVSSYAQGLNIGARMGAERASQDLQQQQLLRQQQNDAVEQARRDAEFHMRSEAQARKYAAQQKYQTLLQSGVDPARALLQVAPDLGESLTGAAQLYKAGQPQQPRPMTEYERYQILHPKPTPPPTSVREVDEIQKSEADATAADQAGDTETATKLRDRAALLREQMKGQNVVTGYDDQGRPIVTVGKGATGTSPTVATASRAQQKLQKYENASEIIDRVQSGLKAGHVGLAGLGGEYLWDKGMVQLANMLGDESATANPERVNSRAGIIMLRESLMRELGDNPTDRTAMAEREEIARALPSSGVFESLSDAQQKMATVRNIMSHRAVVYATSIGQKAPKWSLKALSPDDIRELYKQGKVDRKIALESLTEDH